MRTLLLSDAKVIEKEISNTLAALQKEVGGYIEIPYIGEEFKRNNICIIVNENGKHIGLETEIVLINEEGYIVDNVVGNCLFTGFNGENFVGLNDIQINIINRVLENKGIYNERIVVGINIWKDIVS